MTTQLDDQPTCTCGTPTCQARGPEAVADGFLAAMWEDVKRDLAPLYALFHDSPEPSGSEARARSALARFFVHRHKDSL